MLKNKPDFPFKSPLLSILNVGREYKKPEQAEEGAWIIDTLNGNYLVYGEDGRASIEFQYPEFEDINCYGVCDTPQQFMEDYGKVLKDDERTFIVTFCKIEKDPENKGKGGGWRWHKWGPYVGHGIPTTEYLDDEESFDAGVYVYHIYQWE